MLSWTLVLLAATAANDDLKQAVEKTAKLDGYEFVMTTERTGGFGGRRGGGEAPEPIPVSAKVGQGGVMFIRSGDAQAYKQGTAFVTRGEDGEWALRQADRRGFGRRGGGDAEGRRGGRRGGGQEGGEEGGRGGRGGRRGGGQEGGEEGGRAGRRGAGRGDMRALMAMQNVTPPHETLASLLEHLENVQVEEKDGQKTYTADLNAEGVAAMLSGGRGRRGGRGGGFGGSGESTGKAVIVVNADGNVTAFDVETKVVRSTERGEFEMGSKQHSKLEKHGAVKVEVPEKVQKLLDSADEEIF